MRGYNYSILDYEKALTRDKKLLSGSTLKFSLLKGFGEFFWNLCPVCGNASVRTTAWEDGSVEHSDCLICSRMSEIMEIESSYAREPREDTR